MNLLDVRNELIVDNFAGGGGASTGIEMAIGRSVDIAINHDPAAIAMHTANHPNTKHYCESVWDVDPKEAVGNLSVGAGWFSPDCTDFTRAGGGKPVNKKIRALAWVMVKWCGKTELRVGFLENVEEFKDWCPLIAKRDKATGRVMKTDGTVAAKGEVTPIQEQKLVRDPKKKGKTFRAFVRSLRALGYEVEWRVLVACDYGAATTRKRLFLITRNDGKPIVWPEPTHVITKGSLESINKPVYHTAAENIDWSIPAKSIFNRDKPLADKTHIRIARGIQKFIIEEKNPYIAPVTWGGADDNSQLVAAFLAQYHSETQSGEARGQTLDKPIMTLDTSNRYALVTCNLIKFRGENIGSQLNEPLPTITAGGNHHALVQAFFISYYGASVGQKINRPLDTITTHDRFGLVLIHRTLYQLVDICLRMLVPKELYGCQGFPASYIITPIYNGKPFTHKEQVAKCGNSVSPFMSQVLFRANLPEHCVPELSDRYSMVAWEGMLA
jgi:DNA (cytosine-5)-methyltransferase 1